MCVCVCVCLCVSVSQSVYVCVCVCVCVCRFVSHTHTHTHTQTHMNTLLATDTRTSYVKGPSTHHRGCPRSQMPSRGSYGEWFPAWLTPQADAALRPLPLHRTAWTPADSSPLLRPCSRHTSPFSHDSRRVFEGRRRT
jgi:hypothetical protein